jgi:hypothetical protein
MPGMDAIVGFIILLGGVFTVVAMACMYNKPVQFRFTMGTLLYATLLAAVSVGMFTLPFLPDSEGYMAMRVFAGIGFGGAAIGTLFGSALASAWLTLLAAILLSTIMRTV